MRSPRDEVAGRSAGGPKALPTKRRVSWAARCLASAACIVADADVAAASDRAPVLDARRLGLPSRLLARRGVVRDGRLHALALLVLLLLLLLARHLLGGLARDLLVDPLLRLRRECGERRLGAGHVGRLGQHEELTLLYDSKSVSLGQSPCLHPYTPQ